MKKLLTMTAVTMVALFCRAASVSWNLNIAFNDSDFEPIEGTLAFYLTSDTATALSDSPFTLDGGAVSGTVTGDDQVSWTARLTISNFDGETKSYYMDKVFTMDTVTHEGYADAATYLADLGDELVSAFTLGGALALYSSASNQGYTAVPEPTGGLLMVLGLAGLALRRRRG